MNPWEMDQLDLLARAIQAEAGNEPFEGQAAVAHVIRNRLNTGKWGNTINDVVLAPRQFSAFNNATGELGGRGSNDAWKSQPSETAYAIAQGVMSGQLPDPTGGATHYANPGHSDPKNLKWINSMSNQTRIGQHLFGVADGQGSGGLAQQNLGLPPEVTNANRDFYSSRMDAASMFLDSARSTKEDLRYMQSMTAQTLMPFESAEATRLLEQQQQEEAMQEQHQKYVDLPIDYSDMGDEQLMGGGGDAMLGGGEGNDMLRLVEQAALGFSPELGASIGALPYDMGVEAAPAAPAAAPAAPAQQPTMSTQNMPPAPQQQQQPQNWWDRNRANMAVIGAGLSSMSDPAPADISGALARFYGAEEARKKAAMGLPPGMDGTAVERTAAQLMQTRNLAYEDAIQQSIAIHNPQTQQASQVRELDLNIARAREELVAEGNENPTVGQIGARVATYDSKGAGGAEDYTPEQLQAIEQAALVDNDEGAAILARAGLGDLAGKRIDERSFKLRDAPLLPSERNALIKTIPPEVSSMFSEADLQAMPPEQLRQLNEDAVGGNIANNQEYQKAAELDLIAGQQAAEGMSTDPLRQAEYQQGERAGKAFDEDRERRETIEADAATASATNGLIDRMAPDLGFKLTPAMAKNPDTVSQAFAMAERAEKQRLEVEEQQRTQAKHDELREALATSPDPIVRQMAAVPTTNSDDLSKAYLDHLRAGGEPSSAQSDAEWLANSATAAEKTAYMEARRAGAGEKLNTAEKQLVDGFATFVNKEQERAVAAKELAPRMGVMANLMADPEFDTGKFEEIMLPIKRVMSDVFDVDVEGLDKQTLLNSVANSMFSYAKDSGIGALSNIDVERIMEGLPGLGKDPLSNLALLQMYQGMAEYQMQAAEFMSDYMANAAVSNDVKVMTTGAANRAWEAHAKELGLPDPQNLVPIVKSEGQSAEDIHKQFDALINNGFMGKDTAVYVDENGKLQRYMGRPQ